MKLEIVTIAVIGAFIGLFAYTSMTGEHEWGGTDDQPEHVIKEMTNGNFEPWFPNVWVPPSGEIESLLFALQAAIGSLIIGYFLGYYRALAKIKTAASPRSKKEN